MKQYKNWFDYWRRAGFGESKLDAFGFGFVIFIGVLSFPFTLSWCIPIVIKDYKRELKNIENAKTKSLDYKNALEYLNKLFPGVS